MENKKTNGLTRLAKKVGAIFGTAIAALTVGNFVATQATPTVDNNHTTDFSKQVSKQKPMPVLKLNVANPEESKLVTQHSSHSSHSSHNSHSSHSSHYSSSLV